MPGSPPTLQSGIRTAALRFLGVCSPIGLPENLVALSTFLILSRELGVNGFDKDITALDAMACVALCVGKGMKGTLIGSMVLFTVIYLLILP